ncbi:MAG: nucB [Paenibacillaceae bacterium]|nr:nucB [Paenibacillaceae bacterium]
MNKYIRIAVLLIVAGILFYGQQNGYIDLGTSSETGTGEAVTLHFPADRYPETARHIKEAIAAGESSTCTIDRDGAEENRKESLKGIPTKTGYDRDEWPMAMCAEGGAGADIKYIDPSDNRGAGSWVSNQLDQYPNGTRVQFIVP